MNSMELLWIQMLAFAVLLFIGYGACKIKLWQKTELHAVSKFLVNIAIPIMILTYVPFYCTRQDLLQAGPFLLCGLIFIAIMYGSAFLSAKLAKLKGNTADVHIAESMFGNGTFVGLPVTMAVLGEAGLIYWSVYAILDNLTAWSIGVYFCSGRKTGQKFWRKIVTPTTISLLIAILVLLIGFRPSGTVFETLKTVGAAVPYLAMIYVGGILATFDLRSVFTTKSVYLLVGIKMLLLPLLLFFLITWFAGFLPVTAKFFFCLFAALPSMVAFSMIAEANGSDGEYATKCIFVTTICSMVTIPFIMYVISFLQKIIS